MGFTTLGSISVSNAELMEIKLNARLNEEGLPVLRKRLKEKRLSPYGDRNHLIERLGKYKAAQERESTSQSCEEGSLEYQNKRRKGGRMRVYTSEEERKEVISLTKRDKKQENHLTKSIQDINELKPVWKRIKKYLDEHQNEEVRVSDALIALVCGEPEYRNTDEHAASKDNVNKTI